MSTYYYFNGATGNNDGTSEQDAWTSLVTAMTGLTAGSTLYLKAATGGVRHDVTEDSYGYVYYTLSGTEDVPTVVEGYTNTPGDGGPFIGSGCLRRTSGSTIIFKHLDFENNNGNTQVFRVNGGIIYKCRAKNTTGTQPAIDLGEGGVLIDSYVEGACSHVVFARRSVVVNSYIKQTASSGNGIYLDCGYRAGQAIGNTIVFTDNSNNGYGIVFNNINNLANSSSAINNTIVGANVGIRADEGVNAGGGAQIIIYGNIITECGYGYQNGQVNSTTENSVSSVQNAFYNNTSGNYDTISDLAKLEDIQLTSSPFVDTNSYQINDTDGGGSLIKGLLGLPSVPNGITATTRTSFNTQGSVVPSPFYTPIIDSGSLSLGTGDVGDIVNLGENSFQLVQENPRVWKNV